MRRCADRAAGADPEEGLAVGAEAGGIALRRLEDHGNAQRGQGRDVERLRAGQVADAEADMVEHGQPFVSLQASPTYFFSSSTEEAPLTIWLPITKPGVPVMSSTWPRSRFLSISAWISGESMSLCSLSRSRPTLLAISSTTAAFS